jgi:hypothetical protein
MPIIRATNGHRYEVAPDVLEAALQDEVQWAEKLKTALEKEAAYTEDTHKKLAREMEEIEARLGNFRGGTIFDHMRSIFDDAVPRGYDHALHFPALLAQYVRYAYNEPIQQWIPPPDIQSRDTSPVLAALPAVRARAHSPPAPVRNPAPPAKGKGKETEKQQRASSKSKVQLPAADHRAEDGEYDPVNDAAMGEAGPSKTKTGRRSTRPPKSKPTIGEATDGEKVDTPIHCVPACDKCHKLGRECYKKTSRSACFSCHDLKHKCVSQEVAARANENGGGKESGNVRQQRPRIVTIISPGNAGEFAAAGAFFFFLYPSPLAHFVDVQINIPPLILRGGWRLPSGRTGS